jgi:hypothetical protein
MAAQMIHTGEGNESGHKFIANALVLIAVVKQYPEWDSRK